MMTSKDATDTVKNALDISKQILIVGLIVWFIVDYSGVSRFFADRNIDISDILSLKNSKALSETKDALQREHLSGKKFEADLAEAVSREEKVKHILRTIASNKNQHPISSSTELSLIQALEFLERDGTSLKNSLLELQASSSAVAQVLQKNAETFAEADRRTGSRSQTWLVIFGSDRSQSDAEQELKNARDKGFEAGQRDVAALSIFKRGDTFHPILVFRSEQAARAALADARKISRYSAGAFVSTGGRFCPGGILTLNGIGDCSGPQ